MTLTDPTTINATLAWVLIAGVPVLALAAKTGALGALVHLIARKAVR